MCFPTDKYAAGNSDVLCVTNIINSICIALNEKYEAYYTKLTVK